MAAGAPSAQNSFSHADSDRTQDAEVLLGHDSSIVQDFPNGAISNDSDTVQNGTIPIVVDGVQQPSSSINSHESPLRLLVRTLTPKRGKPILAPAGLKRNAENDGEESRHALKVTFELPSNSMDSASTSNRDSQSISVLKKWCQYPIVPTAGALTLIGGISFGYAIAIISAVLHELRLHWKLSCDQEEVLVGCLIGGAILVSICGGPWIDKCGRRRSILIACSMFLIGTGLSTIANTLDTLSAGRFLQGFGMSMAAVAQCIYVSEIAPKEKRGFMVGLNELGITIGFLLSYICGFALQNVKEAWRIMMALGAIPIGVQIIGTYYCLPPSPREKMLYKYDKEAILVLENLRGSRNEAMNEFVSIRHTLLAEGKYKTMTLFKSKDNMLYRLLMGFSLVALQQFSGQPNMLFYASVVLEQLGFASKWAALAAIGLGIVKVTATGVALAVADKRGRRFFLLLGCLLMAVSMAIVGIATLIRPTVVPKPCLKAAFVSEGTALRPHSLLPSHAQLTIASPYTLNASTPHVFLVQSAQNSSDMSNGNNSTFDENEVQYSSSDIAQAVVCFVALLSYVVGYSLGFGPMTWIVLSELYPAGIKGRAMSLANVLNWSCSLLVSLTFLDVMSFLTPGGTFLLYSAVSLLSALYIFLVVPETTGKSLEKVSYDLRTLRPKQRFDDNFEKLLPFFRKPMNRPPGNPSTNI